MQTSLIKKVSLTEEKKCILNKKECIFDDKS